MSETAQTESLDIEVTVDNRGIPCAMGIFKVMKEMERVTPGRVLEILSTDRSSTKDLSKWTARVGHEILAVREEGGPLRPVFRIRIRKKQGS